MTSDRLYRSRKTRVFGGVAGGLAEYLNIDPVIARLIFVAATFIGGGGVLVYIVMWIVVPEEPILLNSESSTFQNPGSTHSGNNENPVVQPERRKIREGSLWGGVILILIGGLFLMDRLIPNIHFGDLWPLILIVIGIGIIAKTFTNQKTNI